MNILIPTDGSELSKLAVKKVLEIAKKDVDKIYIVTVIPTTFGFEMDIPITFQEKFQEQLKENASKMLDEVVKPIKDANFNCSTEILQSLSISDGIVSYADKNNIDLIVIGSHGADRSNLLIGSVASNVVQNAKCSVYVVKR